MKFNFRALSTWLLVAALAGLASGCGSSSSEFEDRAAREEKDEPQLRMAQTPETPRPETVTIVIR